MRQPVRCPNRMTGCSEWRQVDLEGGEVRLDAGTTKNTEGRVFPLTAALRELLEEQGRHRKELERAPGIITPWVFYRMVAERRAGPKFPKPITAFSKAWANACRGLGALGASHTISAAPLCATSSELAFPSVWPCR